MAKVLRSIMGRKEKPAAAPVEIEADVDEADDRGQNECNVNRRVSISRSGRYKQRNRRRSGLWDNPQLVYDGEQESPAPPLPTATETETAMAAAAAAAAPGDDKENGDSGSVRSKDSLRSRSSSVLQDTSQVAQELLELAEQQLREASGRSTIVTNL